MTRALAFLDRLVVFLIGLLLLLGGLIPAAYLWNIPYVTDFFTTQVDRSRLADASGYSWFPTALIIATAVLALLGLWFVLGNIQNRAFNNSPVQRGEDADSNTILNVQRIAEAACDQLELSPMITGAHPTVEMLGNRPTATFKVAAKAAAPLDDVTRLLELTDEDIADACEGVDIDTVYKLELDRVDS